MRYVGIDPSTKTGIAILDEYGNVIMTVESQSPVEEEPQRFIYIGESILGYLKEDDRICIEGFSYGSKGKGVSTQYGFGWIIRTILIQNGYDYLEIPPTSLKKFATGKGNISKDAMVLPIYKKWGFEHNSDNVRDAYVLAQIARAMSEDIELTNYQRDVLNKLER
ncbi:hypothetical protein [Heyndrickxia oleronia]|uniref:hypothetical protein n=1 Tax=Heyndrickxia oleronia TaxID=38875 RepID=UPI001C0F3678|nr:hypothetical protein [Heyndrickxia oleronia]MBU5214377.1 hypothetical protein [Heyndrickxia oleronia]